MLHSKLELNNKQLMYDELELNHVKDRKPQTLAVSLKPQTINPKFPGTARMLLLKQIKNAFMHSQFQTDVLKLMSLENIMDQEVRTLSGGELQRVAIALALGKEGIQNGFILAKDEVSFSLLVELFTAMFDAVMK